LALALEEIAERELVLGLLPLVAEVASVAELATLFFFHQHLELLAEQSQ
jgi:hypothetical protein